MPQPSVATRTACNFFQGLSLVVGGAEAEAKAKANKYIKQLGMDGALTQISSTIGVDLSDLDLDLLLPSIQTQSLRGLISLCCVSRNLTLPQIQGLPNGAGMSLALSTLGSCAATISPNVLQDLLP